MVSEWQAVTWIHRRTTVAGQTQRRGQRAKCESCCVHAEREERERRKVEDSEGKKAIVIHLNNSSWNHT